MAPTPPDLIRQVAQLARLELTAAETRLFSEQIELVIRYVDVLADLSLEGVDPLFEPHPLETPFREDVARIFGDDSIGGHSDTPKILQSAPDVQEGGFKVPQVL